MSAAHVPFALIFSLSRTDLKSRSHSQHSPMTFLILLWLKSPLFTSRVLEQLVRVSIRPARLSLSFLELVQSETSYATTTRDLYRLAAAFSAFSQRCSFLKNSSLNARCVLLGF